MQSSKVQFIHQP